MIQTRTRQRVLSVACKSMLGLWLLLVTVCSAHGQSDDSPIIRSHLARQNGLELHWFSQVNVSPQFGNFKELVMTVDENKATTFVELRYGETYEVFSENDINIRGERFGVDGAMEWAELQKEILKARGYDATITKYVRPKTTLYSLTTDGRVQAIDAETGKTLWQVTVGDPKHPAVGLAANTEVVGVVSGPYLFCLEADTGLTRWKRTCTNGPTGGVAISDRFLFVTEGSGVVESFPFIYDGLPPGRFISFGRTSIKPHITRYTISWPSGIGYYNVASANNPNSVAYRLLADRHIVAPGGSLPGQLFVASEDGKIYAMDELRGKLNWEYSLGSPVSRSPVGFLDSVYVISDSNRLFKLNAYDGFPDDRWPQGIPDITSFLAASQTKAYFLDTLGRLIALDRETGARSMQMQVGFNDVNFSNFLTDRIYFVNTKGRIQCLREIGNAQPYFHADAEEEMIAKAKERRARQPAVNPFAVQGGAEADDDNPFANPQRKTEVDDDDANPFGGGDSDDDDDPFGGGGGGDDDDDDDDPFDK
ncbi:MAG TPA: PQQ-binding-like beta-propeller repeat protein [Pirellulaceae bacterium]|nr:PQQ-binding-like beta-propeller repeat protein [Pirellulaceae bacterium]HMO91973.1 PQQ-binding-like beta-propeller repeat protein [Pirellulaceae bacterium]HMP68772.1 PQQ-binding-like beta-propeller repeat protein [Pirellulaceae bacterium]